MINAMDAIKKTLEESKFEVTPQKMRQLMSMPKVQPEKPKPTSTSCSPGPIYNIKSQSMRNLRDKYFYIKSKPEIIDYTARNPSPLAYRIPRDNNMPNLHIHPKLKDPRQPISQTPNTLGPGKYKPEQKKVPKLYQKQIQGTELKMTNDQCYTRPFLQMKSAQPGPGSYNVYESYKKAAVTDRIAPTFKLRPADLNSHIISRSPSPADYDINSWLFREKTARRTVLPANITASLPAIEAAETMRKVQRLTSLDYVEGGIHELDARERYKTTQATYKDPDYFKKLGPANDPPHYTTKRLQVNLDGFLDVSELPGNQLNSTEASKINQPTKVNITSNNATLHKEELQVL